MDELYAYEREAAELSLSLFHEAGVHDLDQWLADFFHCDWAYLVHFHKAAEKRPLKGYWRTGTPRLAPRPIAAFTRGACAGTGSWSGGAGHVARTAGQVATLNPRVRRPSTPTRAPP